MSGAHWFENMYTFLFHVPKIVKKQHATCLARTSGTVHGNVPLGLAKDVLLSVRLHHGDSVLFFDGLSFKLQEVADY